MTIFTDITPLPILSSGLKPDANGELWNAGYTEIDANFDLLEGGVAGEFWAGGIGGGWAVPAGAPVTNGHVIQNNGSGLTQRVNLNFKGDMVAADGGSATDVTIGFIYNAVTIVATLNAAVGNFYDLTLSSMTSDEDFNLPTPSIIGQRVAVRVLDSNASYEVIIKANSVNINRLYTEGESLIYRAFGTGAGDWEIAEGGDGKIPNVCKIYEDTTVTTLPNASVTKILLNTTEHDNASLADLGNNQIVARRTGKYRISRHIQLETIAGASVRNDMNIEIDSVSSDRIRSGNSAGDYWEASATSDKVLSAGDAIELFGRQQSGAGVDTFISAESNSYLSVSEIL